MIMEVTYRKLIKNLIIDQEPAVLMCLTTTNHYQNNSNTHVNFTLIMSRLELTQLPHTCYQFDKLFTAKHPDAYTHKKKNMMSEG